jgi:sec-independent protein translocase protein TatA
MPLPGPGELVLILIVVLIVFGPGRLPDVGQAVGKGIREFRKATNEIEDAVRATSDAPADGSRPSKQG